MKSTQRTQIAKFLNKNFENIAQRDEIRKNVKSNVSMYLHHKTIIARYRTHVPPVIDIFFTGRFKRNAYAKPLGDLTYEIGFEDGLLAFFRHFSNWLSNSEDAFPNVSREQRSNFADYMMYCWADLVGFHEYSHIVLGHAGKITPPHTQLNEITEEKVGFFEALASRSFEFEADTWGAKFSFARISTITKFLNHQFYNDGPKLDIYEDYGFIVFSLLAQLEELDGIGGNNRFSMLDFRRTHPNSIVRTLFMRAGISEALNLVGKYESLDPEELKRRFWIGVNRARVFYGYGLLNKLGAAIYYHFGKMIYPSVLQFVRVEKLF